MKNSNDIIGNRTRDLPACSAVPQPTALPRAPTRHCDLANCTGNTQKNMAVNCNNVGRNNQYKHPYGDTGEKYES